MTQHFQNTTRFEFNVFVEPFFGFFFVIAVLVWASCVILFLSVFITLFGISSHNKFKYVPM